jgi:hypothetical protein
VIKQQTLGRTRVCTASRYCNANMLPRSLKCFRKSCCAPIEFTGSEEILSTTNCVIGVVGCTVIGLTLAMKNGGYTRGII